MLLCDTFSRLKVPQEVPTTVWLALHLLGIVINLCAIRVLKKRWHTLGNFSIILATSVIANIFALFVHSYLPINFLLKNATGKEWSLGALSCSLLPPFTHLTQAVSMMTLMAVAIQKYLKSAKQINISFMEAENAMVVMLVTSALIVAPEFCQCGAVTEPSSQTDSCIPTWQVLYAGHFYQSVRVLLQYIIPLAVILNALFKAQLTPKSGKVTCIYQTMFVLIDCTTGVCIGLYIYFFPLTTIILGEGKFISQSTAFPDIAAMLKAMDTVAIFCCIAVPFEIIEIANDEDMVDYQAVTYTELSAKKHLEDPQEEPLDVYHKVLGKISGFNMDEIVKNSNDGEKMDFEVVSYKELPTKKRLEDPQEDPLNGDLTEVLGKINGPFKMDMTKDELIESLMNDEPLRLKNEIIV